MRQIIHLIPISRLKNTLRKVLRKVWEKHTRSRKKSSENDKKRSYVFEKIATFSRLRKFFSLAFSGKLYCKISENRQKMSHGFGYRATVEKKINSYPQRNTNILTNYACFSTLAFPENVVGFSRLFIHASHSFRFFQKSNRENGQHAHFGHRKPVDIFQRTHISCARKVWQKWIDPLLLPLPIGTKNVRAKA